MVFCTVAGKGSKGAIIVCDTPVGYITLRAKKISSHKYSIYSEHPSRKYKTTIYASNIRDLRVKVQAS